MYHRVSITAMIILAMLLAVTSMASDQPKASKPAANTLAVCGCGKVFMPNEKTEYVSHNGKDYACCTHQCHKMAAKDPAGSVKASQKQMAEMW